MNNLKDPKRTNRVTDTCLIILFPIASMISLRFGSILIVLYVLSTYLKAWLGFSVISFILGGFASIFILLYILISYDHGESSMVAMAREKKKADFDEWLGKDAVASKHETNVLRTTEYAKIFKSLDDFIDKLIEQFINSWFNSISESAVFQDKLREELRFITAQIIERCSKLDLPSILVNKILPLITQHIIDYSNCKDELTSFYKVDDILNSPESMMHLAQCFNKGKLHQAVTISNDMNNKTKEKVYFRKLIKEILPLVLSEEENNDVLFKLLAQELLASNVLSNSISMVSDPDFCNTMISSIIGESLKRQSQVKRLKEALILFTQEKNNQEIKHQAMKTRKENYIAKNLMKIAEDISDEDFQLILMKISKTDSDNVLKSLKTTYESQLSSTIAYKSEASSEFQNRLRTAISVVQDKLQNTSPSIQFNRMRSQFIIEGELNLSDILNNSIALQSFQKYLEDMSKDSLLFLREAIERLKAPLEEGDSDLSLSWSFNSKNEIKNIYSEIVKSGFVFDQDSVQSIEKYVQSTLSDLDAQLLYNARRALFKIQENIFSQLTELYNMYKKSERFHEMLRTNPFGSLREKANFGSSLVSSMSSLDRAEAFNEENEADFGTNNTNPIVNAVDNAFSEIMQTYSEESDIYKKPITPVISEGAKESDLETPDEPSSRTVNLKKNLFGDSSSLFGERAEKNLLESNLFDDSFDSDLGSDMGSTEDLSSSVESVGDVLTADSNLLLAAPGDLRLTEKISNLSREIEVLNEQRKILDQLIQKAELSNNIPKLKVLKKSGVNLEKEISDKELQKQQYIVQESNNSLYGKSNVYIQTYITDTDRGKQFTLYIVEVQRISTEDQNTISAGWIVARRFSQFFKLNEYLKLRFDRLSEIKFPKRTVQVLNFQSKQIVEQRKKQLEEYLQALIKIPEICSDRVFRSFLSSENFNIRKNQLFGDSVKISKALSSDNTLKFYSNIAGRLTKQKSTQFDKHQNEVHDFQLFSDMQRELKQLDDYKPLQKTTRQSFVKPICDLLIVAFNLNSSAMWIRGTAIIVILQQVFGTTIERKMHDFITSHLLDEQVLLDFLSSLKSNLFPNNKFRDPAPLRSLFQKKNTRMEANFLLQTYMRDSWSKVFGVSSTNYAHKQLFEIIQNEFLNRHLAFLLLDVLVGSIFPELHDQTSEST